MTLQEAIKSGKPFRRKKDGTVCRVGRLNRVHRIGKYEDGSDKLVWLFDEWSCSGDLAFEKHFSYDDAMATDWEIVE